ncbi:MAG: hypothetical protein AB1668_01160 [Nanoarchaeota archaeon]
MVRVNLFFETFTDEEIKNHIVIRLKCGIQFKMEEGWSQPFSAIIDTGAHLSVIPLSIWKVISHEKQERYKVYGLSKKEDCFLSGEIGKIKSIIVDEAGNQTQEIKGLAGDYYEAYRQLGGSKGHDVMFDDFSIVACATIYQIDIVVSEDNKTMLTENALKAYDLVNSLQKKRTPSFIGYLEFKRWLSE